MEIKPIIILLLVTFLFPLVTAQGQPFAEIGAEFQSDGLILDFEEVDVHQANLGVNFTHHVLNISNGLIHDNEDEVNCIFNLYDEEGKHLIEGEQMTFSPSALGWIYHVDGTNFTKHGAYDYFVYCNTTTLGGFV